MSCFLGGKIRGKLEKCFAARLAKLGNNVPGTKCHAQAKTNQHCFHVSETKFVSRKQKCF